MVLARRIDPWLGTLLLDCQRLALRCFLDFLGALSTAKSSSFAPAFNFSRNQTGCAPLPAHVFPELSRNLTETFRPLSELPPPRTAGAWPNLESWSCNS